jgi:uronate dehydrogenase
MLTKIVLTGAAGSLGSALPVPLSRMCDSLVSVDIKDAPDTLAANETWAVADCAEMDDVAPLMDGAEMVVHFVGIPDERSFEELLRPNFLSSYVVWEAAYRAGARRVVYASSVHAVGMHETNAGIDTDAPHRPDTFYGLSKCFSEDLARLYWEKRGLEAVCLRIFSATDTPQNPRALGTWLSRGDLVRMVERAVDTPTTGFCVVYGISDNTRAPESNAKIAFLGYRPQDNAEDYAPDILAKAATPDPTNLAQMRLGGPFATVELGESGVAGMAKLVKKG